MQDKTNKKSKIINNNYKFTKPFIKWVGGKTQIINDVIELFPNEFNNYYEIFLGGGSVLIALLEKIKNNDIIVKEKIYAFDANETLINVYINIQKNVNNVIKKLNYYKHTYENINGTEIIRNPKNLQEAKTSKESYYYFLRKKFNNMAQNIKNSPDGSALFIVINKLCFKGLYREGPNGLNVPFGHYKNPNIFEDEQLNLISNLIQNVVFSCSDFSESLKLPKCGDFVYLDPPYVPEKIDSFVGYNKSGFNIKQHNLLFSYCIQLHNNKINFLMSNSDVKFVNDSFNNEKKFIIKKILCKRNINAKNPKAKTNEVLINTINL